MHPQSGVTTSVRPTLLSILVLSAPPLVTADVTVTIQHFTHPLCDTYSSHLQPLAVPFCRPLGLDFALYGPLYILALGIFECTSIPRRCPDMLARGQTRY